MSTNVDVTELSDDMLQTLERFFRDNIKSSIRVKPRKVDLFWGFDFQKLVSIRMEIARRAKGNTKKP